MNHSARPTRTDRPLAARPAFTLIELLVVIVIIALLISILTVAIRAAVASARTSAERQTVVALKIGVEQFKNDMGFIPPMLKDFNPAYDNTAVPVPNPAPPGYASQPLYRTAGEYRVNAYNFSLSARNADERDYLRGEGLDRTAADTSAAPDLRFSEYSLAWYVAGAMGATVGSGTEIAPVDGFEGPGIGKVTRGGAFETGRGSFGPYFDAGDSPDRISVPSGTALDEGRVALLGRSGPAIRYYRWLPGRPDETRVLFDTDRELEQLNIPALVGDPASNPNLRNAQYAIVAAGADGGFGDLGTEGETALAQAIGNSSLEGDDLVEQARRDNVVEVGQ